MSDLRPCDEDDIDALLNTNFKVGEQVTYEPEIGGDDDYEGQIIALHQGKAYVELKVRTWVSVYNLTSPEE